MARYRKLGYVALNVTDVARARAFYVDTIGLQFVGEGADGEVFLRCSVDHHNMVLYPSSDPGLKRIGWEMESDQELEDLVAYLRGQGFPVEEVSPEERRALRQGPTFRMVEPNTTATFEFYSVMDQFAVDFQPTQAKIMGLGHIVLKSPAWQGAVDFVLKHLNFRVSDVINERVVFMRCFPNPYHHSLAIAPGPANTLHHVNLMVSEIDDIGRGMARFKKQQIPVVHGPGRHPPSDSIFLYFLDPDGLTVEYSFGMEEFSETAPRKHRVLENHQDSFDYWGCEIDPRKSAVGSIERQPEKAT